ncbi:Oidioi.mRNA.OKI2018_I69.XSR.g13391.t1.cds [Oikopleura dioica]|uniref:Oidioi.mRNA.OKI2018_I69.XSR.g13391.t1.cds n=1 Tax=Oikopleura dioica TaxID=34765 RepID=A0ABN7SDN4_OIKDI|nr:Oidioi.mRNA.OKI2018_I69.XSR.g13391.t1.cds [Oikopleura dioica]
MLVKSLSQTISAVWFFIKKFFFGIPQSREIAASEDVEAQLSLVETDLDAPERRGKKRKHENHDGHYCKICGQEYDTEKHRPAFVGKCYHTFCIKCIDTLRFTECLQLTVQISSLFFNYYFGY